MPAEFNVLSFNHTAFTVSDLDQVIPFFRDLLGFELTSRAPRDHRLIERMTALHGVDIEIAYVNGPGHRIELIQYKAPADREVVVPRLCDAGAAHVALDVTGIEALVAASAAYGFTAVGESSRSTPAPTGAARWCTCAGPTGSRSSTSKKDPDPRAACPAEAAVTASPPVRPIIVDAKPASAKAHVQ